jgi:hypothetical protein
MSNATVVIIDFVVWRARARKEAGVEDVRLEQIIDLVAHLSRKKQHGIIRLACLLVLQISL